MNSLEPRGNAAAEGTSHGQGPGMGERGIPGLTRARRKTNVRKLWILLVIFLAVAMAAFGTAVFVKRLTDRKLQQRIEARNAPKVSHTETGHDFSLDAARLEREKKEQERQRALAAAAASMPVPSGAISQTPVQDSAIRTGGAAYGQSGKRAQTPDERRLDGDVLVNLKHDGPDENAHGSGSDGAVPAGAAGQPAQLATHGSLDDRLAPSRLAGASASWLPDQDFLLRRGINIPCGQKTRIVTTWPGMISCIVTKDIYSSNGHTLLVERGSEATGEQRTALMQGQARIFALWSRIDMPNGVSIDINSPGSDPLGASGLDAYVDTHFWERFGGALMLSVVSDLGQALSNQTLGGGSSQINLNGTSNASQNLAAETLKNTINIPPTAYSNQGSEINIFVARDIDFRSVYELARP